MAEKPRYLTPDDLLGPGEVQALCGVNRSTLKRWRDSGKFPAPWRELEQGPVWIRVDVETWHAKR